jgi:hypothetical protein
MELYVFMNNYRIPSSGLTIDFVDQPSKAAGELYDDVAPVTQINHCSSQ